jgi:uncharacterized membrane protein
MKVEDPGSAADLPTNSGMEAAKRIRPRLDAIDLLRGLVMVLMALDHTRDFFSNARFNPLDLSRTDTGLFFTRWVTHFCAPVFVFLAGTGAFLFLQRGGKTKGQLAWFLFSRGLWLVVLEFTLVHLGWLFRFDFHLLLGQVIWAIGWSMVLLAGMVYLPWWAVGLLGITLIAGHNALDGFSGDSLGSFRWIWTVLFSVGPVEVGPGVRLFVAYPVLPWLGVMAAGYGIGAVYLLDAPRRRPWLVGLGVVITSLFVVLRTINEYGDPQRWVYQPSDWYTVLSFLNCTKYPPSLLFVLMTLGPAILLLAWFDRGVGPLGRPLVIFGRVPLFFYLLHVPVIHLAALTFAFAKYGDPNFLLQHPLIRNRGSLPEDYGYGLPAVYLVWIGVVLVLYPACWWFARVKSRYRSAWLSYL